MLKYSVGDIIYCEYITDCTYYLILEAYKYSYKVLDLTDGEMRLTNFQMGNPVKVA